MVIDVTPSIVSSPVVKIVILLVSALPPSSFIVKYWPDEKPVAAGNLISKAAEADTPSIRSETDEVVVDVTAVLL